MLWIKLCYYFIDEEVLFGSSAAVFCFWSIGGNGGSERNKSILNLRAPANAAGAGNTGVFYILAMQQE